MKRILVVAESALLRTVLKLVLETEGYEVALACAPDAISSCPGETFHLVIVDGQHGEEADDVLVAMQQQKTHVNALILLYGGVDHNVYSPQATLAKPLDLRELKKHVTAVVDRVI
jgi:DNA-binding response OmpR family regulator